jgi:predicted transposase YbfD/YdcC
LSDPVQGHALQCQNEDSPPFRRQVIPENRALLTELVHRETQANVPTRAALGIQLSAISQSLSNYQRRFVWRIESMHWLLDVEFKDDLSRYRSGHGAKNMATVRRFALGLVRANNSRGSVKTRRKTASWDPEFLIKLLQIK